MRDESTRVLKRALKVKGPAKHETLALLTDAIGRGLPKKTAQRIFNEKIIWIRPKLEERIASELLPIQEKRLEAVKYGLERELRDLSDEERKRYEQDVERCIKRSEEVYNKSTRELADESKKLQEQINIINFDRLLVKSFKEKK